MSFKIISPNVLKDNTVSHKNGMLLSESDSSKSQLYSYEMNEILSKPPLWLIQWGSTVFLGVLVLVLVISWWIRYPELINGNLKIVAKEQPKSIVTRKEGRVINLFIKDGQSVTKGQILAQMETTAQFNEVLQLTTLVDSLVSITMDGNLSMARYITLPPFFQLGELQKSYQSFQEVFTRTKFFVGSGIAFDKKKLLKNDISKLQELYVHLQHQVSDQENDFLLATADLKMNEKLYNEKVISATEYRQGQSKYYSKKQAVEICKSQLKSNELIQNQKHQELLELDKTIIEQQNIFLQTLRALKSDIQSWVQIYQAIAPVSGKVAFIKPIQENQSVKIGEELFYILPNNIGFLGEIALGQYNLGKIKIGQNVIVKLNSYPFEQFGTINGVLVAVSELPQDSIYRAQILFPNGLYTSYHKHIPFRNGLIGSAEIITQERSLFEQFFMGFTMSFHQ